MEKRYVVKENKGGKATRFDVFDTMEKRVMNGRLTKFVAIKLEGILNGKPHKDPHALA